MKTPNLLEIQVLGVLRVRRNYLKYHKLLDDSFFRSNELRKIYRITQNFHKKFRQKVLRLKQLRMLLESKVTDADEMRIYLKLLRRIRLVNTMEDEVVADTLIKFAQENLVKKMMEASLNQLDQDALDLPEMKRAIDRAIALGSSKVNHDYDYFTSMAERTDKANELPRIATRISQDLDAALNGGMAAGELGIILAPPKRGKTLALVNIGAGALLQGKKVLHITLEIKKKAVAHRYDCRLTKSTLRDIYEDLGMAAQVLKKIYDGGGRLIIRDYSYSHCGIGEVHALLEKFKENLDMPDMVIIDYADLMIPPQQYKDTRHEVTKIYEELRIIAGEFNIPVWTASQANRGSLDKRVVGIGDIAEAFNKAAIADLVLALCQTPEEKEEKEMRIHVAATRMGSTNPVFPVMADPDRMLMKGIREKGTDESDSSDRSGIRAIRNRNRKDGGKVPRKGSVRPKRGRRDRLVGKGRPDNPGD